VGERGALKLNVSSNLYFDEAYDSCCDPGIKRLPLPFN